MNDLVIPKDLFFNFNDITFFEEPHKYYVAGEEFISVTTLIHKYVEEFKEDFFSKKKAEQHGLTQTQILRAWDFINKKGTMKGSMIHDYSENRIKNKVFSYPEKEIIGEFGFDPIKPEYEYTKKLVDLFHFYSKGRLIPVSAEQIVYDKEAKIAGMFDILYWNIKAQEFQIWDNKTNKIFTGLEEDDENDKVEEYIKQKEKPINNLKGKLSILEDTDLELYSLQLEMYKQLIQRNTSIKLGQSYVVWFSHNNKKFKIIPMRDRKYYIDIMIEERIKSLVA